MYSKSVVSWKAAKRKGYRKSRCGQFHLVNKRGMYTLYNIDPFGSRVAIYASECVTAAKEYARATVRRYR